MTGYQSKRRRSLGVLFLSLGLPLGLLSFLYTPFIPEANAQSRREDRRETDSENVAASETVAAALDQEPLKWAEIIFLRNRAQLLRQNQEARRANVADRLNIGDALRTLRRSRAELRFNDESLARIGERATFQFTPNTRNFQLTNGTVLLIIPPSRGRTTIQTPNATTGIQGSALFVRYIPETDTTIVGALTDNPNGPMVLFNEDGSEQQALRANEIGVIEGDRITELYRFDSELFWESSALAEGFDYTQDSPNGADALDPVRQEIRDAISKQEPLPEDDESIIENPDSFNRPSEDSSPGATDSSEGEASDNGSDSTDSNSNDTQSEAEGGEGQASTADGTASQGAGLTAAPSTQNSTEEGSSEGQASTPETSQSGADNSNQPQTPRDGISNSSNSTNSGSTTGGSATNGSQAGGSQAGGSATNGSATSGSQAGGSTTGGSTTGGSLSDRAPLIEEGTTANGVKPVVSDSSVSDPSASNPSISNPAPSTPAVEPSNQITDSAAGSLDIAEEEEAEPIVDIKFEGTPAEQYLSVPQSEVQANIPDVGETNGLVPAVASEASANSDSDAAGDEETVDPRAEDISSDAEEMAAPSDTGSDTSAIAPTEKTPAEIDEQTAGVDLDTPVSAIDDLKPIGLQDSSDGEGTGVGDGAVEEEPSDEVVDGTDPTAEVPDETEPITAAPHKPELPVDESPTEAESPILPETADAPSEPVIVVPPILPEGTNPEGAEPIAPVETPVELIQPSEEVEASEIVEEVVVEEAVVEEVPEVVETPDIEVIEVSEEAVEVPDVEIEAFEVEPSEVEPPEVEPPEVETPEVTEIPEVETPDIPEVEIIEIPADDPLDPVDSLVEIIDEGSQVEESQIEESQTGGEGNESVNLDAGEQVIDNQSQEEMPEVEGPILL